MKKLMSLIICIGVVLSSGIAVSAVDETTHFIEYAPQYKIMGQFDNGVTAVRTGTEYALINPNNKETAKINGEILGYRDHVVRIYRDGKIIFRSDAGVEFLNITGIYAKPIIGGKVSVQDENFMYGLYNDKGEVILKHDYTNIIYGTGDHILLSSESGWVEYDISQESVIDEYDKVHSSTDEYVICSVDGSCGVINYDGDILIPFLFDKIGVSGDTFIAYSGDTTSCYDIEGKVLYSNETGICGSYSEEVYYNNTDDVHTYKSSSGNVVIDLSAITDIQFGESFHDGYAVIHSSGKKTYIDASGAMMTEQMWDGAYRFSNGFALVMNRVADSETSTYRNQWYIINENFEIVKTLDYDVYVDTMYPASVDFSDGYIRTIDRDTGLMGFIRLDEFDFENNIGYTVSGTITSYLKGEGDITVQLLSGENIVGSTVVNTYTEVNESKKEYSSTYSIPEVVDGTYTLRVSKANHVTRDYTVEVSGGTVTQNVKIHLLGDVTGDGLVDILDHQAMFEHLQGITVITDEYHLQLANTKVDTAVDIFDHQCLFEHLQGITPLFN